MLKDQVRSPAEENPGGTGDILIPRHPHLYSPQISPDYLRVQYQITWSSIDSSRDLTEEVRCQCIPI